MAAVAAWTLAGLAGGVMMATGPLQGTGMLSALATVGGLATGAAVGLSGLAAVSAGLIAYALATVLAQILGVVNGGLVVTGVWWVVVRGTQVAVWASFVLLLGAGARRLVRRRPAGPGGAHAAGPDAAASAGTGGDSGFQASKAGRWTVYWLLALLVLPAITLLLVLWIGLSLGAGPALLGLPLLIAAESQLLRRIVLGRAGGAGVIATAGLVFATTVLWSLVFFLIEIQSTTFTF